MKKSDNSQLQMSFERSENRLRSKFDCSDFLVFTELDPSMHTTEAGRTTVQEMVRAVDDIDYLPAFFAFTDQHSSSDEDLISFASQLIPRSERDQHLIYASGRGVTAAQAMEKASLFNTEGWMNVIPVTGDGVKDKSVKEHSDIPFADSVHVLNHVSGHHELHAGCVVNPYKYTAESLYTQYFKLIKKISLGASYIITHTGWDMMKLQELRWFLTSRDLYTPSIARLELLTPERADDIVDGKCPGLHASPDFNAILAKEARFSNMQFEAAQWRRLQLQVAGCKLLGFSGVQLSGLKSKEHVNIAHRRIAEALKEFSDFDDWKGAYEGHLARADMAPYPYRFYMFSRLFQTDHLEEDPTLNEATLPECSSFEKIKFHLARKLLSDSSDTSPLQKSVKKVLVGVTSTPTKELQQTHFICMGQCPKGLVNGPCGGSKPSGDCELQAKECVHNQRMRRAVWLNELHQIEENYIPSES